VPTDFEPHLEVYKDKSILITSDGKDTVFIEGKPGSATQARLRKIEAALRGGYLDNLIGGLRDKGASPSIEPEHLALLERLIGAVTSEIGRAIVGLSVLILTVKDIEPSQSIRLHKGGRGDFSWKDGIPMRSLDANYVTPALRHYDLLKLNSFGFMMTRSLAENYPYSSFYKAAIRGAKEEWLMLIDLVESGKMKARPLLEALISILINHSDTVRALGEEVLQKTKSYLTSNPNADAIASLITRHVTSSSYSARLLEVAMHSLFQVLAAYNTLPGQLSHLSQMRSANKKHGNVGDIEVTGQDNESFVIEAWDGKFGKPYLRDELEELHDKLASHPEIETVGFVVDRNPELTEDITNRIEELSVMHGVTVQILPFNDWLEMQVKRCTGVPPKQVATQWLTAYVETLASKRREIAPIDEPTDKWLNDLKQVL